MTNEVENVPELRFFEYQKCWETITLGEATTKIGSGKTPLGGSSVYLKSGIPFLRSQNIQNGILDLNELVYIDASTDESMKNSRTYYGDILLNITGASIGRSTLNTIKRQYANLNQHVCIIRLKEFYDSNFIGQYLISQKGQKKIFMAQSGGSREGLNFKEISKLKFSLPNDIEEQQKIGDFFSKLDRQIELEEQKLAKLEEQKKGYMQKLFSQEIRFKDNKGDSYPDWKIVNIGDILEERTERSGEGDMLSVTINNGIIKFDEIDRKDNSSKDKSNYRKVYKDDIAYNSMRMWQGASGKSEYEGIVSPAYTVTIPNENINPDFIAYYFKTHKLIHKFKINSQGLTSDTWNLKYRQLKDIKINLCSKEEQSKIANLLIMYDKLINKQKHKLEILKTNKKGFLQKMFV